MLAKGISTPPGQGRALFADAKRAKEFIEFCDGVRHRALGEHTGVW